MTAAVRMPDVSEEDEASEQLITLLEHCIQTEDNGLIAIVRKFWNDETWESIKDKFRNRKRAYFLWWWNGVRAMMDRDEELLG